MEAEGAHFYSLSLLTELTGKKTPSSLKIISLLHQYFMGKAKILKLHSSFLLVFKKKKDDFFRDT